MTPLSRVRRRVSFLAAAGLAAALLPACLAPLGEDADAGVLEYADAGVPERPEAAPDAGVTVCLEVDPLAPADLPRCSAATHDCVRACDPNNDNGCTEGCRNADTTPPSAEGTTCNDCNFRQVISCLDDNGCHAETAAALCCIFSDCAGDQTCINTECTPDLQEMFICGFYVAPQCFDHESGPPSACYEVDP